MGPFLKGIAKNIKMAQSQPSPAPRKLPFRAGPNEVIMPTSRMRSSRPNVPGFAWQSPDREITFDDKELERQNSVIWGKSFGGGPKLSPAEYYKRWLASKNTTLKYRPPRAPIIPHWRPGIGKTNERGTQYLQLPLNPLDKNTSFYDVPLQDWLTRNPKYNRLPNWGSPRSDVELNPDYADPSRWKYTRFQKYPMMYLNPARDQSIKSQTI